MSLMVSRRSVGPGFLWTVGWIRSGKRRTKGHLAQGSGKEFSGLCDPGDSEVGLRMWIEFEKEMPRDVG